MSLLINNLQFPQRSELISNRNHSTASLFSAILIAVLASTTGCNSRNKTTTSCQAHYRAAREELDKFYQHKDSALLKQSLADAELAIKCPEARRKAAELKIGVLSLLKAYKADYMFIDSLQPRDFKYPYSKAMDYDFFRAMEYERQSDRTNRDKFMNRAIDTVQRFIKRQNIGLAKFSPDVFFDLLFLKSYTESKTRISGEVDSLKKRHPADSTYLEGIKNAVLKLKQ